MKTKNSTKAPSLRYDLILVAALLAVSVVLLTVFLLTREQGAFVRVQLDGNTVAEYPLSVNARYELNGGTNILVIEDGEAYLVYADCPDHTCINTGRISLVGESIICLPNRLAVTVVGEKQDVDLVS